MGSAPSTAGQPSVAKASIFHPETAVCGMKHNMVEIVFLQGLHASISIYIYIDIFIYLGLHFMMHNDIGADKLARARSLVVNTALL